MFESMILGDTVQIEVCNMLTSFMIPDTQDLRVSITGMGSMVIQHL